MNFDRDILLKSIENIDNDPTLRLNRTSSTYDLSYNGNLYPPILVLSVANQLNGGKELFLKDFNNNVEKPFEILKNNGFEIVKKSNHVKYWIEKTLVKNRTDRLEGDRALGKALWSPQKNKKGADIYKNMLKVKSGDIILHLVDNLQFVGVSEVKNKVFETEGLDGTDWDGEAYMIELQKYTPLKSPLKKIDLLKSSNKDILTKISTSSEVFYNKKLDLRQGAYLTPCTDELLVTINAEYFKINFENLPLINFDDIVLEKKFNYVLFKEKVQESNLNFSSSLILRFIASLTSKPFVILSGLSGSGKTKIAQSFAQWICESDSQYKIVPVGADWTNREPLVGYPNGLDTEQYITPDSGVIHLLLEAMTAGNENRPYFLILDEMNLSHVERYFADFLSIMESKDKIKLYTGKQRKGVDRNEIPLELGWPKNVFIIGTVNIDETTYMFSPKVLDRANVIEFRITEDEINNYLANPGVPDLTKLERQGISMAESFLKISNDHTLENNEDISKELALFFNELKEVGAEFGYRSATEILQLVSKLKMLEPSLQDKNNDCLDIAIMQKLLPKLHGSRSKLVNILIALGQICLVDKKDTKAKYFDSVKLENYLGDENVKYPISFEKLIRMYKNVLANGFTSYAEA